MIQPYQKHSIYRAKHWETKGNNHPYHSRGYQDNSHTMVGNTTRIIQIQWGNNNKPLLYHHSLTILRNNLPLLFLSRIKDRLRNYPNSTINQSRIWEPHLAMDKVWHINTGTPHSLHNPFLHCATHVNNNCLLI